MVFFIRTDPAGLLIRHFCAAALFVIFCVPLQAADATSGTKPLGFGPISYFEQHCANCHGSMGSNYGEKFGAGLSDAKLSQVVKEMCDGPGNAPLEGDELQAEIAFHRSLVRHEPFVSWTEADGNLLKGEAPPSARVWIMAEGQQTTATLEEEQWTVKLSKPLDSKSAVIHATKEDKTTALPLAEHSYSHSKP